MCNGMIKSGPKTSQPPTSAIKLLLSLLVLGELAPTQGSECVRPYMVQDSFVNLTETNRDFFPVGTVLEYSCDPGYLPNGPTILTCTALGLWSSEPPQCILSGSCQAPPKPDNGGYVCHPSPCRMFAHGTLIEFFCYKGSVATGESTFLTCQDGQWHKLEQFTCVSNAPGCVRPSSPHHCSSNLTDTNTSLFPVGAILQFSCDPGYLPVGRSFVTCTSLGIWSAEPPRCTRSNGKDFMMEQSYSAYWQETKPSASADLQAAARTVYDQSCVRPSSPHHCSSNLTDTNTSLFPVGAILQFSCDPGYLPVGRSFVTCTSLGIWSAEPPRCTRSNDCIRPSTVQHGSTNLTETNRRTFSEGMVLEYHCDPGYVPDGPNILVCSARGSWSSDPPHCIRSDVCLPPYQLENGGYTCHPSSCGHLSHGTVVEYFCDEGYILKGDYKYLTCQYGEWDSQLKLSCLLEQDNAPRLPLGMPALSIVASTASSVALILFLVVLFVLLQPRLKSLNRRDQGVSGQPVSIMVEGVQVTLPSYEEAVSSSRASASSESRVQIVLSEGQHTTAAEAGPSRPPYLKQQQSETVVVHPTPLSSSSPSPSSSTWTLEHAGAAASSSSHRRPSAGTDQHNLSLDSEMDYSDDMPLLKEA